MNHPPPAPKACLRCGSANVEPGRVQSTGRIYFRPDNSRFFTLSSGDVAVHANMCLECGTIEFVGALDKARKLSSRAEAY